MMLILYDLQSSETETMRFWFPWLPSLLCYCPMMWLNSGLRYWSQQKSFLYSSRVL